MNLRFPKDLRDLSRLFWGMVVVFMPITSFRFFPFLGRDTMVRPLSFYPLAVLLVILVIRILKKDLKLRLNGSLFLFGLFLAVALAASILGAVQNPVPMHGQEYVGRTLRAWVTLAGGMAFFIGTLLMNQEEDDLRFTLKWLYIGLAASIVWGAIQMVSYYTGIPGRAMLNKFQTIFSVRHLLIKKRVAGFAYEPSWLANQLATVYLPWMLAAMVSGYRVFKRKWIEPVLFVGAVVLLICTFSRGGILMSAGSCGLVLLLTQGKLFRRSWNWMLSPFCKGQTSLHKVRSIAIRLGIVTVCVGAVAVAGVVLARNPYFSKIWKSNKTTFSEYMVDIYAGPRLAYASAGFGIFQDHPLTGVGLGASGLYMYDYIPEWSRTSLSEITRQLVYNAWLYPNPKDLFIRLLAETGILGFGLYIIFLLNNLGQVLVILRKDEKIFQFLGVTGLTTWIVLLFYNLTQDSFIDPNGWLNLGIFLAMSAGLLEIKKAASRKPDEPAGKSVQTQS